MNHKSINKVRYQLWKLTMSLIKVTKAISAKNGSVMLFHVLLWDHRCMPIPFFSMFSHKTCPWQKMLWWFIYSNKPCCICLHGRVEAPVLLQRIFFMRFSQFIIMQHHVVNKAPKMKEILWNWKCVMMPESTKNHSKNQNNHYNLCKQYDTN